MAHDIMSARSTGHCLNDNLGDIQQSESVCMSAVFNPLLNYIFKPPVLLRELPNQMQMLVFRRQYPHDNKFVGLFHCSMCQEFHPSIYQSLNI